MMQEFVLLLPFSPFLLFRSINNSLTCVIYPSTDVLMFLPFLPRMRLVKSIFLFHYFTCFHFSTPNLQLFFSYFFRSWASRVGGCQLTIGTKTKWLGSFFFLFFFFLLLLLQLLPPPYARSKWMIKRKKVRVHDHMRNHTRMRMNPDKRMQSKAAFLVSLTLTNGKKYPNHPEMCLLALWVTV